MTMTTTTTTNTTTTNHKNNSKNNNNNNNNKGIEKLWNMQVTIIPIVIGAFGTFTKG